MTEKYRDLVFVTRAIKNGVTPKIKEDLVTMEAYKQEFIDFMVDSKVLKFGEFYKSYKI